MKMETGYRQLREGEVIEEGDEFIYNNVWIDSKDIGRTVPTVDQLIYRRKVTTNHVWVIETKGDKYYPKSKWDVICTFLNRADARHTAWHHRKYGKIVRIRKAIVV